MDGDMIADLPPVRGRLVADADLSGLTWLRVGGPAEALFAPADEDDLAALVRAAPLNAPLEAMGVGSNLIVRDGGLPGLTVRLGRGFQAIDVDGADIVVGAGALDARVAETAAAAGIDGLAFLRGVPGTIGGALRMNAGAYGSYVADVFVEAEAVTRAGERIRLGPEEMGFVYRGSAPRGLIYTKARLRGVPGDADVVRARMAQLMAQREASQPVRDRTAGSTFRNPAGYSSTGAADDPMDRKAWSLIERAGCRGLRLGGAQMSEKHANFLTNRADATAAQLERLGELVRARVLRLAGERLEWEVARVGVADPEAVAAAEALAAEAEAAADARMAADS